MSSLLIIYLTVIISVSANSQVRRFHHQRSLSRPPNIPNINHFSHQDQRGLDDEDFFYLNDGSGYGEEDLDSLHTADLEDIDPAPPPIEPSKPRTIKLPSPILATTHKHPVKHKPQKKESPIIEAEHKHPANEPDNGDNENVKPGKQHITHHNTKKEDHNHNSDEGDFIFDLPESDSENLEDSSESPEKLPISKTATVVIAVFSTACGVMMFVSLAAFLLYVYKYNKD